MKSQKSRSQGHAVC